jgi:hypothetical protein
MTVVEEMELGALLELFNPTSLAGYQKDEAGKLGPFSGLAAPIRQDRRIRAKSFDTARISNFNVVRYLPRVTPNLHES